jgi:hypothetical protein
LAPAISRCRLGLAALRTASEAALSIAALATSLNALLFVSAVLRFRSAITRGIGSLRLICICSWCFGLAIRTTCFWGALGTTRLTRLLRAIATTRWCLGFTGLTVGRACFRRALVRTTVLVRRLCASTLDSDNARDQHRQPDRKREIADADPGRAEFSHSSNEVKYVVQFVTFSGFRLSFQVHCLELAAFCELYDSFSAGCHTTGTLGQCTRAASVSSPTSHKTARQRSPKRLRLASTFTLGIAKPAM